MWVPKESVAKKMDADFKEATILALVTIEPATHASGRREQDQTSLRTSVRTSLRAPLRTSLRHEGRKLVPYDRDWPHAGPSESPGGGGGGWRGAQLLSNCLSSIFIEISGADFRSKRRCLKKFKVSPWSCSTSTPGSESSGKADQLTFP
jgi:hypothetical protein